MYLSFNTNNKAATVLEEFLGAVKKHCLSSRVRGDMSVENADIAWYMFTHPQRGHDHGSFISGKSAHNQRIKRLWVDVYLGAVYIYYNLFSHLERSNLLNVENDIEMFVLHFVFQSRINIHLNAFAEGWDCHKISDEKNLSPKQLWIMSLHQTLANSNTDEVMMTMTEVR